MCISSDHVFFGDLPRLSKRELSLSLIYWDGLIYLIVDTKTLPVNNVTDSVYWSVLCIKLSVWPEQALSACTAQLCLLIA